MRILLVDDSPAMRNFVRRVVTLAGYTAAEFMEAANGAEALRAIETTGPADLVLCDINMPVMDGERFVQEMHARGWLGSSAVVVVSTDSTRTRMERLLELGARGYVQKPFTPEDLRATLARVLRPAGTEAPHA